MRLNISNLFCAGLSLPMMMLLTRNDWALTILPGMSGPLTWQVLPVGKTTDISPTKAHVAAGLALLIWL